MKMEWGGGYLKQTHFEKHYVFIKKNNNKIKGQSAFNINYIQYKLYFLK